MQEISLKSVKLITQTLKHSMFSIKAEVKDAVSVPVIPVSAKWLAAVFPSDFGLHFASALLIFEI